MYFLRYRMIQINMEEVIWLVLVKLMVMIFWLWSRFRWRGRLRRKGSAGRRNAS